MNKKLRAFNIDVDDIETINFENGILQQIARKCAEEYDLKRLELVLNGNIITAKDKFTGINSYMGMRVSLESLEKDISFIIRPTNKPTYDELENENQELKDRIDNAVEYIEYCKTSKNDIFPIIEEAKMVEILKGDKEWMI